MKIRTSRINVKTKGAGDLIDITNQITECLEAAGFKTGRKDRLSLDGFEMRYARRFLFIETE